MSNYYPTTTISTTYSFYNSSLALFDPTTVTCTVYDPDGTPTVYTYGSSANLTKTSTGYYLCTFDADTDGVWVISWHGEDAGGKLTDRISVKVDPI